MHYRRKTKWMILSFRSLSALNIGCTEVPIALLKKKLEENYLQDFQFRNSGWYNSLFFMFINF